MKDNNETIILLIFLAIGLYIVLTTNNKESFGTAGGTFQQLYAKDEQDNYLTVNHINSACKTCGGFKKM